MEYSLFHTHDCLTQSFLLPFLCWSCIFRPGPNKHILGNTAQIQRYCKMLFLTQTQFVFSDSSNIEHILYCCFHQLFLTIYFVFGTFYLLSFQAWSFCQWIGGGWNSFSYPKWKRSFCCFGANFRCFLNQLSCHYWIQINLYCILWSMFWIQISWE